MLYNSKEECSIIGWNLEENEVCIFEWFWDETGQIYPDMKRYQLICDQFQVICERNVNQEVTIMIKMKKSAALILAGVLACSAPMPVMASTDTEVVESLLDSGIDFLASDPQKAVDIIMYAKDLVDQQNITDDQVRSAITQAADHFSVTLSDSEADSLVSVVRKVLDAQINEDALRSDVNSVYNKLKDMGVTKDDAKGLVAKLIDFVKGLFE